MEKEVKRTTYPEDGGWASIQIGTTIIDLRTSEVRNPDGTIVYTSRPFEKDFAKSFAIRTRDNIKIALDLESNGLMDLSAGPWFTINNEHFWRVILVSTVATQVKFNASTGNHAFALEAPGGAGSLLHGPPEVINTTIPPGVGVLTTILDLTGKEPVQAFSFQITAGPLGVHVGYDKDAVVTDPRIGVLQPVNRDGYEVLNKITVIPTGAHVALIRIRGEAWRY